MKKEQPPVYSYLRFSGPKQEKGDSFRRQVLLRDNWLARKGWTLDESLVMPDKAVSAFRGKNLSEGLLGEFIKKVEAGIVPKGAYLIIEKIDRFTRFDPDEAMPVFTRLLKKGITIVTLEPEKEWTAESVKSFGCMELLVHLLCAHEESKKKSDRLSACWIEKKKNAATGTKLTPKVPCWLTMVDIERVDNRFRGGRIVVNEEKAAIVRRIFSLAERGYGSGQISKILNREKIPTLAEWGKFGWQGSSISKLLRTRTVLGEYQPYTVTPMGPKRRVPVGEPIPGYYPAVISEAQWERVQLALDSRRNARGKVGRNVSNLFSGLIINARTGGGLFLKKIGRSPYFIPQERRHHDGGDKLSFSYNAFERAFLTFFHELKSSDLTPMQEATDETENNLARLAEVERKIEKTQARIDAAPAGEEDSFFNMLTKFEHERKELLAIIKTATSSKAKNQKQDIAEAVQILDLLQNSKVDELLDLRARLKNLIRSLVKEIHLLVDPWGDAGKVAFVQITFKSGGERLLTIFDSGKGVKLRGELLNVGHDKQRPVLPLTDLSKWRTDTKVSNWYQEGMEVLRMLSPQAIATKRMMSGELPYKVALDMGISNATCYRWKELAQGKPQKPRKRKPR